MHKVVGIVFLEAATKVCPLQFVLVPAGKLVGRVLWAFVRRTSLVWAHDAGLARVAVAFALHRWLPGLGSPSVRFTVWVVACPQEPAQEHHRAPPPRRLSATRV